MSKINPAPKTSKTIDANQVVKEIRKTAEPERVSELARYFKTNIGQYGAGDLFLGSKVPSVRGVAKLYPDLSLSELDKLFYSPYHEIRLCAAIILNLKFDKAVDPKERKKLFEFYLRQVRKNRINNWDLVDVSAPIIGKYLIKNDNSLPLLLTLSDSKSLWERRTSIIFTFALIRSGDLKPTIIIAQALLEDEEDLIHKAVGWMLREVGKLDAPLLREFLKQNSHKMPRTMLRYAIEKFSANERKKWLSESKNISF